MKIFLNFKVYSKIYWNNYIFIISSNKNFLLKIIKIFVIIKNVLVCNYIIIIEIKFYI